MTSKGGGMRFSLVDRFHETNRIRRMELKPTDLILRRRTDLGFTRDRHIKDASRLQPICGAPSRRMAAGSVSRFWPSFETRARARSSRVGLNINGHRFRPLPDAEKARECWQGGPTPRRSRLFSRNPWRAVGIG